MSRIFVDIDSTIWPAEKEYDKACKQLYGCSFGTNWYSFPELTEKFGDGYQRIFELALAPEKVKSRRLYPGALSALTILHRQGYTLHFITHNDNVDIHDPLWSWLKLLFPFANQKLALSVVNPYQDKTEVIKKYDNVWGIIEDREDTLLDALEDGYNVLAKRQPWNLQTCEDYGIMSFDSWLYVPQMVKETEMINVG